MRRVCALALLALTPATAVVAQTASPAHRTHRVPHPAAASPEAPVDHGPFTPQASAAYQGGGMVLEGAPGAPPPRPQPTPPGQTPAGMVPPQ